MRYGRPELGDRLAADYVLGMMPQRARQRFERAMADDATLRAAVGAWSDRLKPLDDITVGEKPPARVWRAIEHRVQFAAPAPARGRLRPGAFTFWRGLAATAVTACAALVIYIVLYPKPLPQIFEALADKTGLPDWIASAKHSPSDVGLSTVNLGTSERERPRWIRAALLLTNDARSVTVDPPAPPR
jgi:hypothetical protein